MTEKILEKTDNFIIDLKLYQILNEFATKERRRIIDNNWDAEDAFNNIKKATEKIKKIINENLPR